MKKREAKFLLKKKKLEENKAVLESLAKSQLSNEIMNSMVSFKDIHKRKKREKDPKIKTREADELEEESEINQATTVKNFFSEVKKPDQTQVEEESEINQATTVKNFFSEVKKPDQTQGINIFETKLFINPSTQNKLSEDEHSTIQSKKDKSSEALEQLTKKMIPDYNFDTFGTKDLKRPIEKIEEHPNTIMEENESESSEKEDIAVDEQCRAFAMEITHEFRNPLERSLEQETSRRKLPIYLKETEILDSIFNNFITIICGETGSGKSTQVPQFLYESGFSNKLGPNPGRIGITQPRRIAAIALANRVAEEMKLMMGKEIAFQVRHETSNFDENTRIKFMTDGILLNEMTSDYLLNEYSVIIIDEAHERKMNTDLLLGLLSKVVMLRAKNAHEERIKNPRKRNYFYNPLRVVIMSATLRVEDFTKNKRMFPQKINVINVESRQFPVSIYFNKFTPDNYIEEALKKCKKIHKKLPTGDVLVFLTGEREIKEFCYKLDVELSKEKEEEMIDENDKNPKCDGNLEVQKALNPKKSIYDPDSDEELLQDEEKTKENQKTEHDQEIPKQTPTNVIIYPLFSKLSLDQQEKIFKKHSENTRMFVISTNVAETSLTIPNIRYVVDAGKEKKKIFDLNLLISHFSINWISKASADQRSGRAGRTGPGFCYRLYSTPVYSNIFKKFSDPEILNTPIESVILQLKAIGIQNILKFPFPTSPNPDHLKSAIIALVKLNALEIEKSETEEDIVKIDVIERKLSFNRDETKLTELGKVLACIPLHPKYAKMLLRARKGGCLGYMLLIVSALSVNEIFKVDNSFGAKEKNVEKEKEDENFEDDENKDVFKKEIERMKKQKEIADSRKKELKKQVASFKQKYNQFMCGKSDLFLFMNLLGRFIEFMNADKNISKNPDLSITAFCNDFNLQIKSFKEIYYNFHQILDILAELLESEKEKQELKGFFKKYYHPPSSKQEDLIEILIESFIEKVARKIEYYDEKNKKKAAYEILDSEIRAQIHPTSFLSSSTPNFLVYTDIFYSKRLYLKNVTSCEDLSLLFRFDEMRTNKKITYLKNPEPFYSEKKDQIVVWASSEFGKKKWDLSLFEYVYEEQSFEQYYWFALYLLEGAIFKFFQAFKKFLSGNTKSIKMNNLAVNVQRIVNKLRTNKINTKLKLTQKWKEDKKFLLDEVLLWIKPEYSQKVKEKWPPNF